MSHVVGQVDLAAARGTTPWHRASAITKLGLAALVVALAVFAPSWRSLLALNVVAWALALSGGLAPRLVVGLAAYPLLFSGLFVLARWDGTWTTPLQLALRPMTACLIAVWLVSTTPYPDLFAPLSRVLPRSVADGLFITYRALFELLARSERLWRALRLRGGGEGPVRRRLTLAGESLGTLVLYSLERSERLYATMLLRGHTGRICGCRHYAELQREDLWVAAALIVVVGVMALLGGTA